MLYYIPYIFLNINEIKHRMENHIKQMPLWSQLVFITVNKLTHIQDCDCLVSAYKIVILKSGWNENKCDFVTLKDCFFTNYAEIVFIVHMSFKILVRQCFLKTQLFRVFIIFHKTGKLIWILRTAEKILNFGLHGP